jgi:hypothetical protein
MSSAQRCTYLKLYRIEATSAATVEKDRQWKVVQKPNERSLAREGRRDGQPSKEEL